MNESVSRFNSDGKEGQYTGKKKWCMWPGHDLYHSDTGTIITNFAVCVSSRTKVHEQK